MSDWSIWSPSFLNSEGGMVITPKYWRSDGTVPGIIYCHGAGGTEFEARNPTGSSVTMHRIVERVVGLGFPVISCFFGGDVWGNASAVTKVDAARLYLQNTLGAKAGRVGFMGQSMGHLTAMNWVATGSNKAMTTCVFGSMGVCDLSNIAANATYAADIDAAHGGTYTEAGDGPLYNPTNNAAAKYAGLRWLYSVGSSDTTCAPSTSVALASAIGSTGKRNIVAGTHAWATVGNYDVNEIEGFFKQYNV